MNSIKLHEPAIQQDGEIHRKTTPSTRTIATEETAIQRDSATETFPPGATRPLQPNTGPFFLLLIISNDFFYHFPILIFEIFHCMICSGKLPCDSRPLLEFFR